MVLCTISSVQCQINEIIYQFFNQQNINPSLKVVYQVKLKDIYWFTALGF